MKLNTQQGEVSVFNCRHHFYSSKRLEASAKSPGRHVGFDSGERPSAELYDVARVKLQKRTERMTFSDHVVEHWVGIANRIYTSSNHDAE